METRNRNILKPKERSPVYQPVARSTQNLLVLRVDLGYSRRTAKEQCNWQTSSVTQNTCWIIEGQPTTI